MAQGLLNIVATPIGNLEDITLRALRILKEADFVLCEDTRETRKILDHYQIKTPTISYHQHSDTVKVDKIIALLRAGKNLALVTDAGTPGISDPGGKLVSLVRESLGQEAAIVAVPGVSALTAAVSLAGQGFDRFLFLGFLPHKKGRQTMLKEVMASRNSVVMYESKHRIIKLLEELAELEKKTGRTLALIVARELTKMHESVYSGSPEEIRQDLEIRAGNLKGEFVVLVKNN
ncbi:MAG: 16S rRNA (cytidine(1402)-2'-O)-methyltransferase [Patescibacteria group bacterium]|jgi:16S rRNA (cytidine1402-2'-O)-methyltransferase